MTLGQCVRKVGLLTSKCLIATVELSSSVFGESQYQHSPKKAKDDSIRPAGTTWIDSSTQRKVKNISGPFGGVDSESFVAARRANENKSSIVFGDEASHQPDLSVRIKSHSMSQLVE